jgi:hypothetical protein
LVEEGVWLASTNLAAPAVPQFTHHEHLVHEEHQTLAETQWLRKVFGSPQPPKQQAQAVVHWTIAAILQASTVEKGVWLISTNLATSSVPHIAIPEDPEQPGTQQANEEGVWLASFGSSWEEGPYIIG